MRREIGYFESTSMQEMAMKGSGYLTSKKTHLRVPMATKENLGLIALRTGSLGDVSVPAILISPSRLSFARS